MLLNESIWPSASLTDPFIICSLYALYIGVKILFQSSLFLNLKISLALNPLWNYLFSASSGNPSLTTRTYTGSSSIFLAKPLIRRLYLLMSAGRIYVLYLFLHYFIYYYFLWIFSCYYSNFTNFCALNII